MKKIIKSAQSRATTLRHAEQKLAHTSATSRLDAELLLCHALNITKTQLVTWPDIELNDIELTQFHSLICRRSKGEPIAYILGTQSFWTLELLTTPSVLIPRPETELLVEAALAHINPNQALNILDIGTGSGAIALSIAQERTQTTVIATDISRPAIDLANQNKKRHQITNVFFSHAKWATGIKNESIDIVVSNPPYIAHNNPHLTQGDVRFEPTIALTSGATGFDDINAIIKDSQRVLKKKGWLLFEHGWDQGIESQQKLNLANYHNMSLIKDLNGHDRVSIGQRT